MNDAEKIKFMAKALNNLNKLIFGETLELGSEEYFDVRNIITSTLRAVGEEVE